MMRLWSVIVKPFSAAILPLAVLDGLVDELRHPVAANADQVVVVLAGGELEDRRPAVEVVADDEPGLLELGEHPVHRREPDRFSGGEEGAVDILRAHVAVGAGVENLEDPQAGQGRLQPRALEVGSLHGPFSSQRESRQDRVTSGQGECKVEIRLRM